MSKFSSKDVGFLLIDGYSVMGVTTEIEENSEIIVEETTPFGVSDETYASTGIHKAAIKQDGLYDDAADSSHDALSAGHGLLRVLCYGVEGNTIGKNFVGFQSALQTKYTRRAKLKELHKASAEYTGSGKKEEGKILHAHGAETTATGNTQASSVDNAASSANGGAGYLEVSALTLGGYTNVQVTLQDSADDISFADITGGSFTANTSAPDAERKAISGTIRQYTACRWAFSGAGSGQSVTFMAGIVRS